MKKKIVICIGSSCMAKGANYVVGQLKKKIAENNIENEVQLCGSFCLGRCQDGVSVSVDREYFSVSPETVDSFFEKVILPGIR